MKQIGMHSLSEFTMGVASWLQQAPSGIGLYNFIDNLIIHSTNVPIQHYAKPVSQRRCNVMFYWYACLSSIPYGAPTTPLVREDTKYILDDSFEKISKVVKP